MIERVLKNAAYAANQWKNTCTGCNKIKNNFHWRAADKDITLVIHNDTKPMNGIHCNTYRDGKKSAFKTVLNEIKNHPGNLDISFLKELGFTAGNSAEDVIQARFISDLIKNKKENFTWLLNQLKETQLYFLGSEIILFEGNFFIIHFFLISLGIFFNISPNPEFLLSSSSSIMAIFLLDLLLVFL